jgi:hypothetical protein
MTSSSPAVRVANVGPHVRVRKASRKLTLKPIPANQPSPNPTSLEHAREHVRLGQSAAVIRKVPFVKLCFPVAVVRIQHTYSRSCRTQGLEVKKEDAEEETAAVRWHVQNA